MYNMQISQKNACTYLYLCIYTFIFNNVFDSRVDMCGETHWSKIQFQYHHCSGDGSRTPQMQHQPLFTQQLQLFHRICQRWSFVSAKQTVGHRANAACRGSLACLSADVKLRVLAVVQISEYKSAV